MEEMRNTALAYYANMSYDQQLKVLGFYKSIDTNGDGKVSIQEYLDFLKQKGINQFVPPNLFKLLDKNNDGTLDFEECVTFYYMAAGRRLVICDGCSSYLWGLHFLCVECYSAGGRTFDLCCSCYRNNNFSHAHSDFLDNYALLRTRPWEGNTSAGAGNTSAGAGRSYYQSGDTSAGAGRSYYQRNRAAEAVETAVNVVDVAGKVAGFASNAYNFGSTVASATSASNTYNFASNAYNIGSSVASVTSASNTYNFGSSVASVASAATVCTIM